MTIRKIRPLERDEATIIALLVGLGGLRVALAVDTFERWGAEPTIGLAMLLLGLLWLVWRA